MMMIGSIATLKTDFMAEFKKPLQKILGEDATPNLSVWENVGKNTIEIQFWVIQNGLSRMRFSLTRMPGCCGILVSHGTSVGYDLRNKGLGSLMQNMKEWIARRRMVGKMIATTLEGNEAQNHLMQKFNWKRTDMFINPKTHNRIIQWEKHLSNN